MDTDFPGAHSMDTSWYAIDKNGNVGYFMTGSGGAVPGEAYSPDAAEWIEDLDPETRAELEIDEADLEELPAEQLPDQAKIFHYEADSDGYADIYQRTQAPKKPIHIDQLAPKVRDAIGKVRFETIDFKETKAFQPVELTECGTWDPAYLASDGKTVKPVPGRESEYAEFYKENQGDYGPGEKSWEEPKKSKSKKRGKKKQDKDEE